MRRSVKAPHSDGCASDGRGTGRCATASRVDCAHGIGSGVARGREDEVPIVDGHELQPRLQFGPLEPEPLEPLLGCARIAGVEACQCSVAGLDRDRDAAIRAVVCDAEALQLLVGCDVADPPAPDLPETLDRGGAPERPVASRRGEQVLRVPHAHVSPRLLHGQHPGFRIGVASTRIVFDHRALHVIRATLSEPSDLAVDDDRSLPHPDQREARAGVRRPRGARRCAV